MNLNEYQIQAVNDLSGNIGVIATAGSGKTAVIIERIKKIIETRNINPSKILAISFSKKACENLSERISKCGEKYQGVEVRTFHSLALKIVNEFYNNKYKVWTTVWEKEKLICDICKQMGICKKDEEVPTAQIFSFISVQKVCMLFPNDNLLPIDVCGLSFKQLGYIYSCYEEEKDKQGYIEFDDIINLACKVLSKNKGMCQKYNELYDYIFVDEYQDIAKNQNVFLHLINGNDNLFVVGDSLQAIYAFRGGDCKYLLDFQQDWAEVKVYNLPINYRCSADIVDCANTLASYIPDSQSEYYQDAIANNGNNATPVFSYYDTVYDECEYIANIINEKVASGYKNTDIAILARTNAQLQNVQTQLTYKGIACEMENGSMFWDLPEIKLILSYLKLAYDTNDDEAFTYCFNKPNRWLNKQFLQEVTENASKKSSLYDAMFTIDRRNWRFKGGINELSEIIYDLRHLQFTNVGKMISYMRKRLSIDNFILKGILGDTEEIAEKINNLNAFEKSCEEFSKIEDLLNEVTKTISTNNDIKELKGAVKLMTIHKSKGLEFPIVFITGCSDGLLPHKRNENVEDEKRLFYVAITRAEKELYLTHSELYNGVKLMTSPFISYLEDTIIRKD